MAQRPPGFRFNRNAPLAKGLVFAGLGGYRCPGTSLFADSSGYGKHGTLTNMDPATDWIWVPELGRWGLDFDGSDDRVEFPAVTMSSTSTAAFWAVISDTGDGIVLGGTGGTEGFALYFLTTSLYYRFDGTTRSHAHGGATSWFHYAVTRNGANVTMYKNGVALGTQTTGTGNATMRAIGSYSGAGNAPTTCKVCDVLIVDRTLAASEIQQLADPSNAMLSGLILPPKRRLWPVVAASPTNPSDVSGSSAISLGASAALRARGALAGQSAIAIGQAATIQGRGRLSGASGVSLGAVGQPSAIGVVSGSSDVLLDAAGTLRGRAPASGSSAIALAAAGAIQGRGNVQATSTIVLDSIGSLSATGALRATATVSITHFAALSAMGSMAGSGTIVFAATGNVIDWNGRVEGPYRTEAGQVWIAGATSAVIYVTGAVAGLVFVAGQDAGQVV